MADSFTGYPVHWDSPADHAFAITPSDGSDLAYVPRAIYVGGYGDVAVITAGGETVTFVGMSAGDLLPVRASRVMATGTTATSIVGIW